MRTIIDYTKLYSDEQVRHNAAIQDIKIYLGPARFKHISQQLQQIPNLSFNNLKCNCEFFLGIDGYPVVAWARELGLTIPDRYMQ